MLAADLLFRTSWIELVEIHRRWRPLLAKRLAFTGAVLNAQQNSSGIAREFQQSPMTFGPQPARCA